MENKNHPNESFYARCGRAIGNPDHDHDHVVLPDDVPSAATTSAEMLPAELPRPTPCSCRTKSPIRQVASTSPTLVAKPYTLFPDSDGRMGTEPNVHCDTAQIRGLNYGSPRSSSVYPGYVSPYYSYGNSSNGRPSSFYRNHGTLESPYSSPGSFNMGNVGYANGGFYQNWFNRGNLGHNFVSSYNMYRVYQPTMRKAPYSTRGVSSTYQTEKDSDLSAQILTFMTSRVARSELERHRLSNGFVCNLACIISRDREVLTVAAQDENGVEFLIALIDVLEPCHDLCKLIVSTLEPKALEFMFHRNSYKLVLRCIAKLKNGLNKFYLSQLLAEATKNCLKLARHEHGKVFLKECIKHFGYPDNRGIVYKLVEYSVSLAKHAKGNYVVQALLQLGEAQSTVSVCQALKRQLEELSMDQRGSYVVQEALRSAGGMILMAELARFEKDRLETLATDRYGNYILQTAVKESKKYDELHNALVSAIKQLYEELKDHIYGGKVLQILKSVC